MPEDIISQQVRQFLDELVPQRPAELQKMEAYALAEDFPIIGPAAGYFCYQITRMMGARRVFELGSGYGYSTAWFARAVQENGGGEVHHVVWDEKLSCLASQHLGRLGYAGIVRYRVSEAVQALREAEGTFDLVFNDIDKHGYPEALPVIKSKLRPGGVLIVDNILWSGRIFNRSDKEADTEGIRKFTQQITSDPDWFVSVVPIRDGLILAYRRA
jgi:predicted O-methyltransferase YrrM